MSNSTTIKEASSHWPGLSGQAYLNAANFIRKYLAPLGVIDPASRAKLYPAHLLHAIYAVYSLKDSKPHYAAETLAKLLTPTTTVDHTLYSVTENQEYWHVVDINGNVIRKFTKNPHLAAMQHCCALNTNPQ